ncbi:MAG: response regulator transcription factor [Acidobacteria bacterium]|nr:response regulator transcription factor [Acidobacteriota bacterium]MCI0718661.1 response regulator transcription factor [Acidobacteriota bacterium]
MSTVLIVEDEQHLADGLRFNLEAEGYQAEVAGDGETALELLTAHPGRYHAVVLDVMLPGIDGFAVASELRKSGQFVPVLILTAMGRAEDVLRGFEAGADDYLPKPFELAILLARLRGLLRRRRWLLDGQTSNGLPVTEDPADRITRGDRLTLEDQFHFDGKTIDFAALQIRAGERIIPLTLMEANLLRHLVQHSGRNVSRKSLLEEVWGLHEDTDTRAIDNFIVRLRRYIEAEPSQPKHLLTVRGIGYRFVAEPEK